MKIVLFFLFIGSINSWATEGLELFKQSTLSNKNLDNGKINFISSKRDTLDKEKGNDSTFYYANGQVERIDHYSVQGVHISSKYFRVDGTPAEIVSPDFIGGRKALNKYLLANIRYPKQAAKKDFTGKVFVHFWIDEQGKVYDPKVLLSPHESLSEEALRLVSDMPAWTPGTRNGKPHKAPFVMPISFQIK